MKTNDEARQYILGAPKLDPDACYPGVVVNEMLRRALVVGLNSTPSDITQRDCADGLNFIRSQMEAAATTVFPPLTRVVTELREVVLETGCRYRVFNGRLEVDVGPGRWVDSTQRAAGLSASDLRALADLRDNPTKTKTVEVEA